VPEHVNDLCKPYVEETRQYKSLHFEPSEFQSRMSKLEPTRLVLDYTRTMMGFLLFDARPERIGMVGLGGGSLAKFCFRELPQARIDVVEINPHVVALREEFLVPADGERFCIHLEDGACFIERSPRRFDVLLVDAYTRQGLPSRLSSQAFYDQCRDALVEDGVMVVNLSFANSDAHVERIRKGFGFGGAVFSVVEEDGTNRVVFACTGDVIRRRRFVRPNLASHLSAVAWSQLKPAFMRIALAMRIQL
jgi:spermidine synthase